MSSSDIGVAMLVLPFILGFLGCLFYALFLLFGGWGIFASVWIITALVLVGMDD